MKVNTFSTLLFFSFYHSFLFRGNYDILPVL
nr:MAG TPA: hypothetical protein [Caudoviricetes sp.]